MEIELSKSNYIKAILLQIIGSKLMYLIKDKRKQAAFNCICSAAIIILAHGFLQFAIIFVILAFNYVAIISEALKPRMYALLNIVFLCVYERLVKDILNIPDDFDLVGIIFMLVIKSSYAALQYNGCRIDAFNYVFMVPGLLAGPAIEFNTFLQIYEKEHVAVCGWHGLVAVGGMTAAIAIGLDHLNLLGTISTSNSFIIRLLCMYGINIQKKSTLYCVWSLGSACYSLVGIDFINLEIWKVELASDPREISRYWNICTHNFLKNFFYRDMRKDGYNQATASVTCFIISSIMHSTKPHDFIFFISAALITIVLSHAFANIAILKENRLLRILATNMTFVYFIAAKATNDIGETMFVWKRCGFIGHYFIGLLFVIPLVKSKVAIKMTKKTEYKQKCK